MKTFISSAVALIAILLVETAILSNWYILPIVPDLLMIMVLYIAYTNGSMLGQTTGFFSGIILDFSSASPLGLNALVRTIMGFVFGKLHQNIRVTGLFIPMIIGFLATILKAMLFTLVSFFYPSGVYTYFSAGNTFITECFFNSILTPIMFKYLASFSVFKKPCESGLLS